MTQTDNKLFIHGSSPLAIYIKDNPVLKVMINSFQVWPIQKPDEPDIPIVDVLSCFGLGYWMDDYPWTDDIPWTD